MGSPTATQRRDFIYVDDTVRVIMWLLATTSVNGIFNVGTGVARSFRDLILAAYCCDRRQPQHRICRHPEHIRGSYQYFTQGDVDRLQRAGYNGGFTALEDAVGSYVRRLPRSARSLPLNAAYHESLAAIYFMRRRDHAIFRLDDFPCRKSIGRGLRVHPGSQFVESPDHLDRQKIPLEFISYRMAKDSIIRVGFA